VNFNFILSRIHNGPKNGQDAVLSSF